MAQLINQPTQRDLRGDALRLERDPDRRYDTIRHLGDSQLLAAAAQGRFGEETRRLAAADITELLVQAAAVASEGTFSVDDAQSAGMWSGTWRATRPWTPTEQALLLAAGHCAYVGLFLTEIGALMDATDVAIRTAMRELHAAGCRLGISSVLACSFGPLHRGQGLAAGVVVGGAHDARIFGNPATAEPTATPMWRPNPHCYGRLYMAAYLSHPARHPEDVQNLPDFVEAGLAAGGYHLRLDVLHAAQFGCGVLETESRQRMIDVLSSYDSNPADVGTNSTLIEVLASYGEIEPINSLDGIRAEIAELLAAPDNPDHHELAQSVVSRMFEDERILGPYNEAIDTLPDDQRMTLFAMAALAPGYSFIAGPYSLRHLSGGVQSADGIVARALAQHASMVPDDTFARQEVVASHLHALRGWARISDALPFADQRTEPLHFAWRLFDELLLLLFRDTAGTPLTVTIWRQLSTELPAAAVTVLHDIYRGNVELVNYGDMESFSPHRGLIAAYPEQIRVLLEWVLAHRQEFPNDR